MDQSAEDDWNEALDAQMEHVDETLAGRLSLEAVVDAMRALSALPLPPGRSGGEYCFDASWITAQDYADLVEDTQPVEHPEAPVLRIVLSRRARFGEVVELVGCELYASCDGDAFAPSAFETASVDELLARAQAHEAWKAAETGTIRALHSCATEIFDGSAR